MAGEPAPGDGATRSPPEAADGGQYARRASRRPTLTFRRPSTADGYSALDPSKVRRRLSLLPALAMQRKQRQSIRQVEHAALVVFAAQKIWRYWTMLRERRTESCKPDQFSRYDGVGTADYGSIVFEKHGVREPARYIRLWTKDTSDIDRVVGLVTNVWAVPRARVVISLTGGAQDLNLKPHVHDVINRGLVRAAQLTHAWIVTGGTDTGVMKLVGDAVRDYQANVPCIGVGTWGVTYGREQLSNNRGGERFYRKLRRSDKSGAPLQPSHTHFLLLDSGHEGKDAWGGEIDFRMEFEKRYCERYGVPTVHVAIGGGAGTLRTIKVAVQTGVPTVLITDSGGAPAVIAHYMRTEELAVDPRGERGFKPPPDVARSASKLGEWKEQMRAQVAEIVELNKHKRVLTAFSARLGADVHSNLDLVLLNAMLFDTEGNLRQHDVHESKQMLQLAIEWGRKEVVQAWMEKSPTLTVGRTSVAQPGRAEAAAQPRKQRLSHGAEPGGTAGMAVEEALREGLLLALTTYKADIVDLLLGQNVKAAEIDLLQLWHGTDMRNFDVPIEQLERGMRLWEQETLGATAKKVDEALYALSFHAGGGAAGRRAGGGWLGWLSTAFGLGGSGGSAERGGDGSSASEGAAAAHPAAPSRLSTEDPAPGFAKNGGANGGGAPTVGDVSAMHAERRQRRKLELYRKYVVPFIAHTFDMRELSALWLRPSTRSWRVQDLFYWAVCDPLAGERLVHVLWCHVDEPIRSALVASHMSSVLARLARFGAKKHEVLAHTYESWAVGVLDQCQNEIEARWLLQRQFDEWPAERRGGTLMSFAVRRSRKAFVAHAHAQATLDAWWRGDIVERFDAERGFGSRCLLDIDPPFVRVLLHAATFTLLGLIEMQPTLAAKYHHARREQLAGGPASPLSPLRRGKGPVHRSATQHWHNIFLLDTWRDIDPPKVGWWAEFRDFYAAPKTKFVLRTTMYVCFLALYAAVLVGDDGKPDLTYMELGFYVWALSHAVDEAQQLAVNLDHDEQHFGDEGWNVIDAIMFWALFPIAIALRVAARVTCCAQPQRSIEHDPLGHPLATECTCEPAALARLILAVNAVLCFVRFLANYRVHKRLGVLIHVIFTMLSDVQVFVYILSVVVCGFALAFGGIAPPRMLRLHGDASSPFLIPIWSAFDLPDIDQLTEPEHSEAPFLGMALLAVYLFVAQILLVNLLIAMMNSSYAKAQHSSEEEWAASRATSVMELRMLLPCPPPFSLPYLGLLLLARLGRNCLARCGLAERLRSRPQRARLGSLIDADDTGERKRRYFKFLHDFLEEQQRRHTSSIDQRMIALREDVDRLASMLETAAADRADSKVLIDRVDARLEASLPAAALQTARSSMAARASTAALGASERGQQALFERRVASPGSSPLPAGRLESDPAASPAEAALASRVRALEAREAELLAQLDTARQQAAEATGAPRGQPAISLDERLAAIASPAGSSRSGSSLSQRPARPGPPPHATPLSAALSGDADGAPSPARNNSRPRTAPRPAGDAREPLWRELPAVGTSSRSDHRPNRAPPASSRSPPPDARGPPSARREGALRPAQPPRRPAARPGDRDVPPRPGQGRPSYGDNYL